MNSFRYSPRFGGHGESAVARLLAGLAQGGLFVSLTLFDMALGQAGLEAQLPVAHYPTLDQQDPADVIQDDAASGANIP